MVWVLAAFAVAGVIAFAVTTRRGRSAPTPEPPAVRTWSQPWAGGRRPDDEELLQVETACMLERAEADVPDLMVQVERDALALYEEANAAAIAAAAEAEDCIEVEDDDGPPVAAPVTASSSTTFDMAGRDIVRRQDYLASHLEDACLCRGSNGLPELRLVDAGDRLAAWSPADGGVLINPKGPGLRKLGLYASYARGMQYASPSAARGAPRNPGVIVELRRDPTNAHDPNAVAFIGPRGQFGWVQRGRAPAVARHLDAGEDFAAVCLREGFYLVGARTDLVHMLT